jgi:hypothetical protein
MVVSLHCGAFFHVKPCFLPRQSFSSSEGSSVKQMCFFNHLSFIKDRLHQFVFYTILLEYFVHIKPCCGQRVVLQLCTTMFVLCFYFLKYGS